MYGASELWLSSHGKIQHYEVAFKQAMMKYHCRQQAADFIVLQLPGTNFPLKNQQQAKD